LHNSLPFHGIYIPSSKNKRWNRCQPGAVKLIKTNTGTFPNTVQWQRIKVSKADHGFYTPKELDDGAFVINIHHPSGNGIQINL